jgi:hypothetical protein
MKYRHILADVRLSETHTQRVVLPEWEIPVLQAVHGNNVTEVGTNDLDRKGEVEASNEFTRLAEKYKGEPDQPPYVAAVYGLFGPGVTALGKAIKAATVEDEAELDPLLADIA